MAVIAKFIKRESPPDIEINDFLSSLQDGGVAVSQDDLQHRAMGLIAANMRIDQATTNFAPTAGTAIAGGIWLPGSVTVTNLVVRAGAPAAGTPPTSITGGLIDPHGEMIALTPNLASSSMWLGTGLKEMPLSTPITLSDAEVGLYYVVFLQVGSFGTTQLSITRAINWGSLGVNGSAMYGSIGTGLGALPAVGTQQTLTAGSGSNIWVAVD